ncbi:unnamed protein product [Absidia cylindrospora]
MNNNAPAANSSSPDGSSNNEENRVRWTHFNADDAQDTLQINNPVTQSTYSEYSLGDYISTSSTHDVSKMPSTGGNELPGGGLSEGFSSDPDFARWTTVTPDIQQGQVAPVVAATTVGTATAASASASASAATAPIRSQAMVKSDSGASDKPSMERNTYTSGLRFSSVILPDDIQHPILSSPTTSRKSSVSSMASYHALEEPQPQQESSRSMESDKPIGNATFDYYQQRPAATATSTAAAAVDPIDTSTSSFRWSDIVAASSPDKPSASLEAHPLGMVVPTATATHPSSSSSSTQATTAVASSSPPSSDFLSTSPPTAAAMEPTASSASSNGGGNGGHSALDGRAASKKMIQDYFSSRGEATAAAAAAGTKESGSSKRQKYKSDFKRAMQAALENNNQGQEVGCSQEHPYLYVAKFDFNAREHGELGFEKGDPIIVIDAEDDIWWMGYKDCKDTDDDDDQLDPQQGVFPSNYVERATMLPY